jgi:hypothetical protein
LRGGRLTLDEPLIPFAGEEFGADNRDRGNCVDGYEENCKSPEQDGRQGSHFGAVLSVEGLGFLLVDGDSSEIEY